MQPGQPNAGWYQDPYAPSQLRYWDGSTWTEHVHSNRPPPTPEPEKSFTYTNAGILLGAVAIALLLTASLIPDLVLFPPPKSTNFPGATVGMMLAGLSFTFAAPGLWVSWLGFREHRDVEPRPRRTMVAILLNVVALVACLALPMG